jgi:hypothetical protein
VDAAGHRSVGRSAKIELEPRPRAYVFQRVPTQPLRRTLGVCLTFLATAGSLIAQGKLTLRLEDFAAVPISGQLVGTTDNSIYAARVNFLREEPGGNAARFFVNDLNGKLYVLDRATKQFTTYLDFHRNTAENANANGLFAAFTRAAGYANGFVTFQFDPEYRSAGSPHFGKFYTVHIELDTNDGDMRRLPNASSFPGYTNAAAYSPTTAFEAPGNDNTGTRHAVLIEWQDTNPTDATFQGTAREVLRIEFNGRIHPLGDLVFNPRALSPSDPDYRKMYVAVGDGGAGEQNNTTLHPTPQRLDVLQGKILRLSPDDPDGAGPLRYGIPNDNPFTGPAVTVPAGTRGEIWAYGFRNPHRLAFDPLSGALLASDIGFHTWEEVNLVRKGANYGYGEREGTFVLDLRSGNANVPLPANDAANGYVYPVVQYPHSAALGVGDAISGGFVYRGTRIPELRGKFVFGDITTGKLFYSDLVEMTSADDGNPATLAEMHPLEVLWDNPRDAAGPQRFERLYEIVLDEYRGRGGQRNTLPGAATVSDLTGGGRADIRLAMDHAGELYVLSKSDGMIRAITGVVAPTARPAIVSQPRATTVALGNTAVLSVETTGEVARYQWKRDGVAIPGATRSIFANMSGATLLSGDYTVDVINAAGTVTSAPARVNSVISRSPGTVSNFSIRSAVGSGAQTFIVGFATSGPAEHAVLVRGVGPGLAPLGVLDALPDPRLDLFRGSTRLLDNDNWGTTPEVADVSARFGAFPLPANSRDAAILFRSPPPDVYTAQISSVTPASGVVLAELFAGSPESGLASGLLNVSARTVVGTGENTLIAGFSISGSTDRTVLIRAAGPALNRFKVTGTLANPKLTLFRGTTPIAENDDWQTSPALVDFFAAAGAFEFVAHSGDAVLLLTLPPGLYTAQVSGLGTSATGVALVEVYAFR